MSLQNVIGRCGGYVIRRAGKGYAAGLEQPDGRWIRSSPPHATERGVRDWCLLNAIRQHGQPTGG